MVYNTTHPLAPLTIPRGTCTILDSPQTRRKCRRGQGFYNFSPESWRRSKTCEEPVGCISESAMHAYVTREMG